MRLDREGHPDRRADRRAEKHMVGEEEVGRQVLSHRCGVPLDELLALGLPQILEAARLQILVPVEHEDGQRTVELRAYDRRATEVELFGMRLLAEHDDLVPELAPRPRERTRVDVRARAAEEVAVPDENLHPWKILTHRWSNGRGEATAGPSSSSSSAISTVS